MNNDSAIIKRMSLQTSAIFFNMNFSFNNEINSDKIEYLFFSKINEFFVAVFDI